MNKDFLRGIWRALQPLRHAHGLKRSRLPGLYSRYFSEWRQYKAMGGTAPFSQISPVMFDRDPSTQSGGGHYFFQDVWALKKLAATKPVEHHDVGSRLDGFTGQATAICPVVFYDIRPPSFTLPGLTFREGSVLAMPLPDKSLMSLSCLHTAEHIGLGRYGDPLDPMGTHKTLKELGRILAIDGQLLFSMPVGQEKTEFNAQRIWPPSRPVEILSDLELVEFSAVNDAGQFLSNIKPADASNEKYACGLYEFRRRV